MAQTMLVLSLDILKSLKMQAFAKPLSRFLLCCNQTPRTLKTILQLDYNFYSCAVYCCASFKFTYMPEGSLFSFFYTTTFQLIVGICIVLFVTLSVSHLNFTNYKFYQLARLSVESCKLWLSAFHVLCHAHKMSLLNKVSLVKGQHQTWTDARVEK